MMFVDIVGEDLTVSHSRCDSMMFVDIVGGDWRTLDINRPTTDAHLTRQFTTVPWLRVPSNVIRDTAR